MPFTLQPFFEAPVTAVVPRKIIGDPGSIRTGTILLGMQLRPVWNVITSSKAPVLAASKPSTKRKRLWPGSIRNETTSPPLSAFVPSVLSAQITGSKAVQQLALTESTLLKFVPVLVRLAVKNPPMPELFFTR